ncbi:uncharacterized protein LTR77_000748 [Saxophila tyrrhenica]|uniref:Uncharacterized protein n=1 Tax=Saxophila tyrrhenica TaxID=1690608 RepID=A0AAV9PNI2_9PEZI|nr:hypothetical protein LTR77_000748 [Saxophila tyrrhenica]
MTSVVGIVLGPFIGGAIQSGLNWRWIYWIQLIVDAAFLPFFYWILRETRGDVILAKRAQEMRKAGQRTAFARSELDKPGILKSLKISFMRPTKMLFTEFVVSSFTLWVSFAWGILFLFQSSVPIVLSKLYGFDTFQTSMIQLALSCGAIIATILNPVQDMLYLKSAGRNMERPGKPIPEARLYFAVPGSLLFTAGMFCIYLAVVNYLADAYEKYAASALSAASFGRNVFGAFLPLATPALYRDHGFQWSSSLIGFIALVLSAVPLILLLKGEAIRARSPFMLDATYDDDEANERRNSIPSRHTKERKPSTVMPWSTVRTVGGE